MHLIESSITRSNVFCVSHAWRGAARGRLMYAVGGRLKKLVLELKGMSTGGYWELLFFVFCFCIPAHHVPWRAFTVSRLKRWYVPHMPTCPCHQHVVSQRLAWRVSFTDATSADPCICTMVVPRPRALELRMQ